MLQQQALIIIKILMLLDAFCIVSAGYLAFFSLGSLFPSLPLVSEKPFIMSIILIMVANNYTFNQFGLYSPVRFRRFSRAWWQIFQAVAVDFMLLAGVMFFLREGFYSRTFMLCFAALTFLLLGTQRFLFSLYTDSQSRNGFNRRKILIVGQDDRAQAISKALERQLSWGHELVCDLSEETSTRGSNGDQCALPTDRITLLPQILTQNQIDEVVFAITSDTSIDLKSYTEVCRTMGIPVRILPALWNPKADNLRVENVQGIPFLSIPVNNFNATGLLYKRLLDVLGGLVGIVIFLALFPFVAAAIKLDSPGPVLFRQRRVGQNGRLFNLLKFRTMFVDAEERKKELTALNVMKGPMFKLKNDPRVTRVGRFLRKTSIDEFPQFVNVLRGEMSLVGTRPPTLDEVKRYDMGHRKRISAKPGITGLWQISGRNRIDDFQQVVELDCQYLEKWRFLDDIKILLKTVVVVLMRKGAL
jgi:exopolysaccharide biosynthesis polyprenyl glycosylphosphotransferase